jgi:hypothetical protein
LPAAPKRPRILLKKAVDAYLADAVSRNVSEATLDKLETIFKKQFLAWTVAQGFEYIDEIDLDAYINARLRNNRLEPVGQEYLQAQLRGESQLLSDVFVGRLPR